MRLYGRYSVRSVGISNDYSLAESFITSFLSLRALS
jgi:hypothetical protein